MSRLTGRSNAGQSVVEYALIIALAAIVIIPTFNFVRGAFVTAYGNQRSALQSAPGGATSTPKVMVAAPTPTATTSVNAAAAVPTDTEQCKNGGWQTSARADGTTFKNQGDCVSYVQNGK